MSKGTEALEAVNRMSVAAGKLAECTLKIEKTNKLAREIADEAAISSIECMTLLVEVDGEQWQDLDDDWNEEKISGVLAREIRYLEGRGLLLHHSTQSNLVQIVEVSL